MAGARAGTPPRSSPRWSWRTVPFLVDRVDTNHSISEAQVPWQEAVHRFHGRSLVFVEDSGPYLLHLNPFSANPPDLDGRILYATDRGDENLDLIADHPGRRVYFERTNLSTNDTLNNPDLPTPTVTVTPMHVERAASFTVHVTVRNTTDDPTVTAFLSVGDVAEEHTLSTTATRGDEFETEWTVAVPTAAAPESGTIPLSAAHGTIVVGTRHATSASATPRRAPHTRAVRLPRRRTARRGAPTRAYVRGAPAHTHGHDEAGVASSVV